MDKLLVAAFVGLAGWTNLANADLFSSTGPVIAILEGNLFHGEAEGHLDGSGTVWIQSSAMPELGCRGQFTSSAAHGGEGSMRCSDGGTVIFRFTRLSLTRGHGEGLSSRGKLSFTYGLSPADSEHYLKAPAGKSILVTDKELLLVNTVQQ